MIDFPRYSYMTSKKHGGPGPGSPVHVPLFEGETDTVYLTEGELKADTITSQSHTLAISIPGVSCWSSAIPALKKLNAKRVILALDADARRNANVAKATANTAQALFGEGFNVELAKWSEADGKGLDDLLVAGKMPEIITGKDNVIKTTLETLNEAIQVSPGTAEYKLSKAMQITRRAIEKLKQDSGIVFKPEVVGALALIRQEDPPEWARIRQQIKKGGVSLRDLNDAMAKSDASNSHSTNLHLAEPGEKPKLRLVKESLPEAPVPEGLVIPPKCSLTLSGTFMEKTRNTKNGSVVDIVRVAPGPLLITGRSKDIDDQSEFMELAWERDGRWQHSTIARGTALNSRSLVDKADIGFPVDSNTASSVVEYLSEFEAVNIKILPCAKVSHHLGWQGGNQKLGFLWGRTLIRPSGEILASENGSNGQILFRGADAGDEQLADGYHSEGSFDKWVNAVAMVAVYPRVLLAIYAALVPPLLSILRAPNFAVDFSYPTSTGKTTTLRGAASVWGNPDERSEAAAIGTWDSTRVWIERTSTVRNDLPLILDDTKRARQPKVVGQTLYDVVSGRGRGRGSLQGTRRSGSWSTVLLSTGEAPATSFTEDGGTRARCLTPWGAPFGRVDEETAKIVHGFDLLVKQNYGHAGPRFVQFLVNHREDWAAWREEYRHVQVGYLDLAGNDPVAGRFAAYFAVLAITAAIAHRALDLPWGYQDPVKKLWKALMREAGDADRASSALSLVRSWAQSNEGTFCGRHSTDNHGNSKVPTQGWSGRWDREKAWEFIAFYPHLLIGLLKKSELEPDPILRVWRERGWLDVGSNKGRNTKQVRIDGENRWMIVVLREALDALDVG